MMVTSLNVLMPCQSVEDSAYVYSMSESETTSSFRGRGRARQGKQIWLDEAVRASVTRIKHNLVATFSLSGVRNRALFRLETTTKIHARTRPLAVGSRPPNAFSGLSRTKISRHHAHAYNGTSHESPPSFMLRYTKYC